MGTFAPVAFRSLPLLHHDRLDSFCFAVVVAEAPQITGYGALGATIMELATSWSISGLAAAVGRCSNLTRCNHESGRH
jgi:hypothetical protein